jgi:hypothetical protein
MQNMCAYLILSRTVRQNLNKNSVQSHEIQGFYVIVFLMCELVSFLKLSEI